MVKVLISDRRWKGEDPKIKFKQAIDKIKKTDELEELYFKGSGLTEIEINLLSDVLLEQPNLRILDLSYNQKISATAMPFLKKIIQTHPKLELLSLECNEIKDQDICALVRGNSDELNKKIASLKIHLGANYITEVGLKEILGALSPASILSLLYDNLIRDRELIESSRRTAMRQLKAAEVPEPSNLLFSSSKVRKEEGKESELGLRRSSRIASRISRTS